MAANTLFIPSNYFNVLNENEILKKEKQELEIKTKELSLMIDKYLVEIDILRYEKNSLDKSISDYNIKLQYLDNKINELNNMVNQSKNDYDKLKLENIALNEKYII